MINRKIFDKVLKRLKKVIGYSHMPILLCAKLEGDGQALTISGTSIQVSAVETIPAAFTGACCVNLKELMGALKGMNGSDISLELAADSEEEIGKLKIFSADGSRCSLNTLPADEFPTIISVDEGKKCFTMAAEVLGETLKRCYRFVSDDETRPYIYGMHMLTTGDYLRMEATDGHRLIIETMIPCEHSAASNFILPRIAIPAMLDKINGDKGSVEVRGSKNHVFFGFNSGFISAKKPDAEFPPLASVIPEHPVIACQASRKELLEAVKGAKAMADNGDSSSPATQIHVAPEKLKVAVDLPASGGGFEKAIKCRANGWAVMGFSPAYLVNALQVLGGEFVVLEMSDAVSGMVIHEGSTTIVVMPIRLEKDEKPVVSDPIDTILGAEGEIAEVSAA